MAITDKVCFDRILPNETRRPRAGRMLMLASGPTRAAFQIAKLWQNGSTISIRFLGGTSDQQVLVKQYAVKWTESANLRFEFGNAPNAQVRIAFNDDGAWSYIGTDALGIPAGQPTMNFGWLDEGVILHEFGHMIGMIHEHQNPRENPIQWNKQVVNAALSGPPNFWDQDTIDHNMYAQYDVAQINGSTVDPQSVMLYSFPASWTVNGFHTDPTRRCRRWTGNSRRASTPAENPRCPSSCRCSKVSLKRASVSLGKRTATSSRRARPVATRSRRKDRPPSS